MGYISDFKYFFKPQRMHTANLHKKHDIGTDIGENLRIFAIEKSA